MNIFHIIVIAPKKPKRVGTPSKVWIGTLSCHYIAHQYNWPYKVHRSRDLPKMDPGDVDSDTDTATPGAMFPVAIRQTGKLFSANASKTSISDCWKETVNTARKI